MPRLSLAVGPSSRFGAVAGKRGACAMGARAEANKVLAVRQRHKGKPFSASDVVFTPFLSPKSDKKRGSRLVD